MRRILPTLATLAAITAPAAADPLVERGAYLANIMHCNGCHTPRFPDGRQDMARFLAGGTVGFEIPGLGIFWPPNLTPDATGLAGWSDAEIVTAIREGLRPDGRMLAPAMPANDYQALSDADAAALVAYLRSLPPTAHAVPGPVAPGAGAPGPFYTVAPPS